MSAFLGKIHYWLFNKILWFENLEERIIEIIKNENLDVEELKKEIESKYGKKLPKLPLEDLIDHNNIHGWLQEKIHNAENRMASYTKALLQNNKNSITKIEEVYIEQGINAAEEVKANAGEINDAKEIFTQINNYILDGMPCDRVNEILTLEEDLVMWKRAVCVHKDIWENKGIDVKQFYDLRDLWIKMFVKTLNNKFEYKVNGSNTFSIEKIIINE